MSGLEITSDARETIKAKLRAHFDGKIVRKDLTKKIKEGANVPIYVLEFLLGQYCSSDDDAIIETGVQQVKRILADNFVRPDESQKILSQLRKRGSHTVIDMITVQLDIQKNRYFAQFSNLGLARVPIEDEYPEKYDRLLCGGIWCIVQLDYESVEEAKKNGATYTINSLKEDVPAKAHELTEGYGPTVTIDAACVKGSLLTALQATGNAGRVITMGFSVAPTEVNQFVITSKELDVRGSRLQNRKFQDVIDLVNEGKVDLRGSISHTWNFEDAQAAFDFVDSRDPSYRKGVLTFKK
jgi:D-arabinose 1-dehydrogenase-like Zn-dependent alcohol dehydrogenase